MLTTTQKNYIKHSVFNNTTDYTHPTSTPNKSLELKKDNAIMGLAVPKDVSSAANAKAKNHTNEKILDGLQLALDLAGLVPVYGEAADGANALISLARGNYADAALSAAAMIPFAGWAATAGKGAKYAVKAAAKYTDEAAAAGEALIKNSSDFGNITKGVGKTVVIGESMAKRVIPYAKEIDADYYDGFKYYDKAKEMFGESTASFIGGVDNALWIIDKIVHKYKIVDIGIDATKAKNSPYYLMESVLTYLYKHKELVEDFFRGVD